MAEIPGYKPKGIDNAKMKAAQYVSLETKHLTHDCERKQTVLKAKNPLCMQRDQNIFFY